MGLFVPFINLAKQKMIIKYFVKETGNDLKKIFVRLRDGRKFDKVAWTEKQTSSKLWNPDKEEIRNISQSHQSGLESRDQINNYLADLKIFLTAKYNEDFAKSLTALEKDWLKDTIKSFNNRIDKTETSSEEYFLTDWITNHLEDKKNLLHTKSKKPLSVGTIKSYKSALSKIKEFERHSGKHFRFEDVTYQKFYQPFLHYLREVDKLNENTSGKYITILKTFLGLIDADERNLPISLDFQKKNKFMSVSEDTSDVYLNETEINKIFKLDLSLNPRLDNVRDIFIIGLWTGLRISDFKRLDISNIKDEVITITTQKTNKKVGIGIHPQLRAVLDKRDGEFPKMISDQKFNEYVKEVVALAEIKNKLEGSKLISVQINGEDKQRKVKGNYEKWELVSSHSCRRSFATNMYKSKALPLIVLMSLTGHKTESQFIEYVKTTPEENARLMNDYFNGTLAKRNLIAPLKAV